MAVAPDGTIPVADGGDGRHRGRVRLPGETRVRAILGDDAYAIARGDWDVAQLRRYSVTWSTSREEKRP